MSSTRQRKQDLRDQVLSKREAYSLEEWQRKSDQILRLFLGLDEYKNAEVVHSYVSINERREVCTDQLIEELFQDDKKAVVPIVNFTDETLSHSVIHSLEDLERNQWGVREPKEPEFIGVSELDIIIVPMAAADRSGNRLGYGKGFYDRFLQKANALKVGFVFDEFLFDEIPVEEFDVKLDVIITEEDLNFP
ncbi:MAG: 5-formyltetrahydrofolate cyclo-ligase [Gracilimonas sp.]